MRKANYPKDLARRYGRGLSVLELSIAVGISRSSVKAELLRQGVALRTPSEQHTIRNARYTPEQRKAHALAANQTRRGSKERLEVLCRHAANRSLHPRLSSKEIMWQTVLAYRGIKAVPQYAVGPYNIDFAVRSKKIAFEVQGTWHSTPRKTLQDQNKRTFLASKGWRVVDLHDGLLFAEPLRKLLRAAGGRANY